MYSRPHPSFKKQIYLSLFFLGEVRLYSVYTFLEAHTELKCVKVSIFYYRRPPAKFWDITLAARKNKFVLVVGLRRINILRVPSNGVHLYIKNSKLFDVKMALRPSTRFRLFKRNSFYALSVISRFVKSRDLFHLIDGFR